jgi:hypothetical protein
MFARMLVQRAGSFRLRGVIFAKYIHVLISFYQTHVLLLGVISSHTTDLYQDQGLSKFSYGLSFPLWVPVCAFVHIIGAELDRRGSEIFEQGEGFIVALKGWTLPEEWGTLGPGILAKISEGNFQAFMLPMHLGCSCHLPFSLFCSGPSQGPQTRCKLILLHFGI